MDTVHRMPFGAEITADGSVRFRLWAPAARSVDLVLYEPRGEAIHSMAPESNGWFSLTCGDAGVGTRYHYRLNGDLRVPDPASRFQPDDVHGPSEVIDPSAWKWRASRWRGRPWEETVLYELHVGSFSPEGTYEGVVRRLDHLAATGVTALELMPVSDFPGRRNWGYDGVLPFAPDSVYGRPEALKALIDAAHERELMVFMDVVYNHFGPEGNYLHAYAPQFFTERHHTPWGAAVNFDGPGSETVREFFIHNALYWLAEYGIDGLRLDAVHAILDDSRPDILQDIAARVQQGPAKIRHVHLVLENDNNAAHYLERDRGGSPVFFVAQWNDDAHHALHLLSTDDSGGYYEDYADRPMSHLGRCLTEGFAYQGEASPYRSGAPRGEPSAHLPPTAFVSFLQNHDQVGNRAFGERIAQLATPEAVRAASSVFLLAPSPPLLFMGQEWGTARPFPFFCDFGDDLAGAVTEGRRREFERFPQFKDPAARASIPDPVAEETFESARLDWREAETASGREWLSWHRDVLQRRQTHVVPWLKALKSSKANFEIVGERALIARWQNAGAGDLILFANLSPEEYHGKLAIAGYVIFETHDDLPGQLRKGCAPAWSVAWLTTGLHS